MSDTSDGGTPGTSDAAEGGSGDRRWWWAIAALVAIIVILLLLLLLQDDDDGDDAVGGTTTTSSSSSSTTSSSTSSTSSTSTTSSSTTSTTAAPPTTTTTAGTPPVTADPDQCREAGSDPTNPDPAAQAVFISWTRGDVACAEQLMTPDALADLFGRDGSTAQDVFQGCSESIEGDPHMDCAFTYPGGSTHYRMNFSPTDGWTVFEVYQVAD